MPSCWSELTTNAIMWHWLESNMSSGITFSNAVAMNGFRIFKAIQALYHHPSMHSPDKSAHSQLEMLETLWQQPYHSVYFWKLTLESTFFRLHTLSLQEWLIFILCGSMKSVCLYISHLQSLFEMRAEEDRGLIHIDNAFFHDLSHLLCPYILHEIKCTDAASAGEHWDSWVPIRNLNPCAFDNLYTINDFAPSDLAWKFNTNQMPFSTQFMLSLPYPAHEAQTHT